MAVNKTKIRSLLNVRSYYSLLTSVVNVDHYLQCAVDSGLNWLSLIDRGTMFYHLGFYLRCQKLNIKPVLGISFLILFEHEPIESALIAKNFSGIQVLMRLSSIFGQTEAADPRISWTKLQTFLTNDNFLVVVPNRNQLAVWSAFKTTMNNNQLTFYLGVNKQNQHQITDFKVDSTHHLWFATVRYLFPEHRSSYQLLQAIKDRIPLKQVKNDFNSCDLVSDQFPVYLTANAERLVAEINLQWKYASHHEVFAAYVSGGDQSPAEHLRQLAQQGLKDKLQARATDRCYQQRLQYELQIINECKFQNYFLVVYDYVQFAKSHDILVGPGRGSAAASLVSYALGITDIDPVQFNLIFERFLNSERSAMPDIDVDVQDNKRELVINYLVQKYGADRVAYINTFQRLKLKMALRDVGRAYQVPLPDINDLTKLIGDRTYDEFKAAAQKAQQIESVYWAKYQLLFRHLPLLIGLPRQTGTHAAGVIISQQPLVRTVPTMGQGLSAVLKTQWDMVDLNTVGLIKMDILGLTNLTVIAETLDNIRHEQAHHDVVLTAIPLRDQATFRLLAAGETAGIFQLESVGMTKLLMNMRPRSLEDIAITSALFRPGPAVRKELYLTRRNANYHFRHPTCSALDNILQPTLGVIIFQEQVMLIVQQIASFSLNQADMLRRAMTKKDPLAMTKLKTKFWTGALSNGWHEKDIDQFWTLIARFSSYGFNRAHALVYSLLGYWMAYLKANFWIFFITALLNSVVGEEIKTHYYLKLVMQRQKIAPPTVNRPTLKYIYHDQVLQLPLVLIHQVGRVFAAEIKRDFAARGPYQDVFDLFRRLRSVGLNRQTYLALVYSGALDDFQLDRGVLVNNYDIILNYAELTASALPRQAVSSPPPLLTGTVLTAEQRARTEFQHLGFYLTQHPVSQMRQQMVPTAVAINQLLTSTPDYAVVVGWVNRQKIIRDKHDREMAFIDIEDESASTTLIAFAANYQRCRAVFKVGDVVRANVKRGRPYREQVSYTLLSLTNLQQADG